MKNVTNVIDTGSMKTHTAYTVSLKRPCSQSDVYQVHTELQSAYFSKKQLLAVVVVKLISRGNLMETRRSIHFLYKKKF